MRAARDVMGVPFDALKRDVSELGHLLGDALVEQEGPALLELEELIRALAKERRTKGRRGPAAAHMHEIIKALDGPAAEHVARAFTHYFQLVNLAEQHHRTRRRRDYARERVPQPGSFEAEFEAVARAGVSREVFARCLEDIQVELVFTAHPSEAQRRTVLDKHRRIATKLMRRDRVALTPDERDLVMRGLLEEVTTLWQTDELRQERPRVGDEVKSTLFYIEEVLFPLVPAFYETLERATERIFGQGLRVPTLLTFGSWVGADMDGNPNVTPAVALDTAHAQSIHIIALYIYTLSKLGESLSQSVRCTRVSEALVRSLAKDEQELPEMARGVAKTARDEPYREKLRFMQARLELRRKALLTSRRAPKEPFAPAPEAYRSVAALLRDLRLVQDSLAENQGVHAGLRQVRALIRQVETFGFHLAKLDVRVHARWLREGMPEGRSAMKALADIRKLTGGAGAESFILSMAHGERDMLRTLELARELGLYAPEAGVADLAIVPLFETQADLDGAGREIERAFAAPEYRRYLTLRGQTQEIMVGYSDSNKDAGILSSSFALYRAQQELVRVARRNEVRLKIFHGRGGSIGRGGGPSQRAIESLPEGSIGGRFKLTEQGEVVGFKYLLPEIAERNLERTVSGVVRASVPGLRGACGSEGEREVFEHAFDEVSRDSRELYRALVRDRTFLAYYEASTPLEEIAMLNIGSRPTHRRREGERLLEDLRAIPWVFAWTQSRQMVPGFFGAGRALRNLVRARGLAFVRRMHATWPFFATTLDAVAVSLATADMDIAARYAALAEDRAAASRIFRMIAKEHGRAVRVLCEIFDQPRILAHRPTLERAIELRNPYVDPLSFIQIELLRRKRRGERDLDRAILLTINGIAAGLHNTG